MLAGFRLHAAAIISVIIFVASLTSCDKDKPQQEEKIQEILLTPAQRKMMGKEVAFSRRLMQMMNEDAGLESWSVSPLGVFLSLAMLNNFASEDASKQIMEVLGLESYSKDEINDLCKTIQYELDHYAWRPISSGQFLSLDANMKWNESTIAAVAEDFNAYQSMGDINDAPSILSSANNWIEHQVSDIVSSPLPLTGLVLGPGINLFDAFLIRERWWYGFPSTRTSSNLFRKSDGSRHSVEFMQSDYLRLSYYHHNGRLFIFRDSIFGQMRIYQPGLMGYNSISVSEYLETLQNLETVPFESDWYYENKISMPIMKEGVRIIDIKDYLYRMGITKIFEDGIVVADKPTKVSSFYQVFYLLADETGIYTAPEGLPLHEFLFKEYSSYEVNASFFYEEITAGTNSVVFAGRFEGDN